MSSTGKVHRPGRVNCRSGMPMGNASTSPKWCNGKAWWILENGSPARMWSFGAGPQLGGQQEGAPATEHMTWIKLPD